MSYYNHICATCQRKEFIKPGTESGKPSHDRPELDEQHDAVALELRSPAAQDKILAALLAIVRELAPTAATVNLETSDQNDYGFVLYGLSDEAGADMDIPGDLQDAIAGEIGNLEWNMVVGEDQHGYATIPVTSS